MPLQIGICDDNAEDIKKLSEALYSYDDSFQILDYAEGESLIEDYSQRKILFDILFLDIYMPGLSGIEAARKIRASMKDVKIIFISSSNEHYPEAYDVFAFNYLIKPVNREKLNRVLDHALMDIKNQRRQQIHFSYKGTNYRIFCRDILYIESRDKIIFFHMEDRTTLQCYGKVDDILKQLPGEFFIRCHQSFVVNIFHVTEMAEKYFRVGMDVINISRKYHKISKDKYFEYLFTHMNNRGQ
jgi:DNA-binding LytR/AlgR family response regulator